MSWLITRLDELRDNAADTRGIDPTLLIPSQAPAVLSILGDQGIGKSTTLRYVCDYISDDVSRILTPVVSPERFADGDTLFGWVLAALTELLPERLPEAARAKAPGRADNLTVRSLSDLLRRQEALARSTYQDASAMVSANPDEWAEGVAAVTTAGLHLVTGWVSLLNGLSPHISQIVIPVDDADQVPGVLSSVLRDLRWLTVHPLVTVVVCVNEEMLLQALMTEPELQAMEVQSRKRHAIGVLTKALPRHLRLNVSPIDLMNRPSFEPHSGGEPLVELLRRFKISEPPPIGPGSLGDLFELKLGNSTATSPYAEILPRVPRQLDQLWRELHGIATDSSHDQRGKTAAATQCLVERALERELDRAPDLPHKTIRFFRTEPYGPSAEFDFDDIASSQRIGAGYAVHGHPEDAVRASIRRIDGFILRSGSDGGTLGEELPAAFTNAHYFALDLAEPAGLKQPPLFLWGYTSKPSLPGGSNWFGTIEVIYRRETTDHRFAIVPAWESYSDYHLYAAAWNATWKLIKDLNCERNPKLLEWTLLRHLLFVTDIQRQRAIDVELIESARDELTNLDTNWSPAAGLDRLANALDGLYKPKGEVESVREGDLNFWVDAYLAWSADGLLGVPELSKRIMSIRNELVDDRGRREEANADCAKVLSARLRRSLADDWIVPTIDLVRSFDPDTATGLTELHEVAREERDGELEAYSTTLEERGVPREVVGQLFLMGVTKEVAEQLRVAGLPSAAIHTLAQRFAPAPALASGQATDPLGDDSPRH